MKSAENVDDKLEMKFPSMKKPENVDENTKSDLPSMKSPKSWMTSSK